MATSRYRSSQRATGATGGIFFFLMIAELPRARGTHPSPSSFQGVKVPEVESEAAKAKRCQRKKRDIGQRGVRERRSGRKTRQRQSEKERPKDTDAAKRDTPIEN
ncbi:hypothetical protein B0H13DRAFT_1857327 [Mycena leptocephala]|nr:hypothetical protein B0H13DRAFT_1857327 [Mycena leptocephala]